MFRKFLGSLLGRTLLTKKIATLHAEKFLNSKLRHGYFSANVTKISEQLPQNSSLEAQFFFK